VGDADLNISCTIIMEEGQQKFRRLSYMAKFKHEGVWFTEEKGNSKAAGVFVVDGSGVRLWQKYKQ
jgi:hypothetical protein